MRHHVTARAGWLLSLAGVAAAFGALLVITRNGFAVTTDAQGAGCRSLWGETVAAASWSRSGAFLGVRTTGGAGLAKTRVFSWPGMNIVSEVPSGTDPAVQVAIDDDGTVYWSDTDPFADGEPTTLWRKAIGGERQAIGRIPTGRYFDFVWAGGALLASEYDQSADSERIRLARLSLAAPGAAPAGVTPWSTSGTDLWSDRTGDWQTWTEVDNPDDVTAPEILVVQHAGQLRRYTLPGYGGRVPTLAPAHDAIIYQRSETARLTMFDLATGAVRDELDDREFFGGEVSATGILAAPTAHGPFGDSNDLCVLDVNDELTRR